MSGGDLSEFTAGAQLERLLRALKAGENFRMSASMLADITVPANPLDRQTPEYLANWFHARMPFHCTLHYDIVGNCYEISRPSDAG